MDGWPGEIIVGSSLWTMAPEGVDGNESLTPGPRFQVEMFPSAVQEACGGV